MMEEKASKAKGVKCRLVGENGNVFNLISLVSKCLRSNGFPELEKEFKDYCMNAKSYDEVLMIIQTYVEVE